jgi:hypothetical protein
MALRANVSIEGSVTAGGPLKLLHLRDVAADLCARLDIGGSDGASFGVDQADFDLKLNDRYPITNEGETLAQEAIYIACEVAFLGLGYALPTRGDTLTVKVQPEEPGEDEEPVGQSEEAASE